jgi:peroxiredoxin
MTMAETAIEVGDVAPNFTLKDQNGNPVTLDSLRGKKVVLSWHPLAWTGLCRVQMQDLEKHKQDFSAMNAVALGLSVDSSASKKAWAQDIGVVDTQLLADFYPHGGVAQVYGVFNEEKGSSERGVFVIDEDGLVRWKKVYPRSEVPDIDEILKAVEEV